MSIPEAVLPTPPSRLSCAAVDGEAIRYFFNEVPVEVHAALRAHLAECPRCRKKLQLFERAWRNGTEKNLVEPNDV